MSESITTTHAVPAAGSRLMVTSLFPPLVAVVTLRVPSCVLLAWAPGPPVPGGPVGPSAPVGPVDRRTWRSISCSAVHLVDHLHRHHPQRQRCPQLLSVQLPYCRRLRHQPASLPGGPAAPVWPSSSGPGVPVGPSTVAWRSCRTGASIGTIRPGRAIRARGPWRPSGPITRWADCGHFPGARPLCCPLLEALRGRSGFRQAQWDLPLPVPAATVRAWWTVWPCCSGGREPAAPAVPSAGVSVSPWEILSRPCYRLRGRPAGSFVTAGSCSIPTDIDPQFVRNRLIASWTLAGPVYFDLSPPVRTGRCGRVCPWSTNGSWRYIRSCPGRTQATLQEELKHVTANEILRERHRFRQPVLALNEWLASKAVRSKIPLPPGGPDGPVGPSSVRSRRTSRAVRSADRSAPRPCCLIPWVPLVQPRYCLLLEGLRDL